MVAGAVGSIPIHKYLGLHAAPTDVINTAYIEAYNEIWNFRARNRSETLYQAKKRTANQTTLAPAFWQHEQFKYVVPDWDDVAMEGSVDLSFTNSQAVVRGLYAQGNAAKARSNWFDASGANLNGQPAALTLAAKGASAGAVSATNLPQIFADLASAGIKISLANIELAKRPAERPKRLREL